MAGILFQDITTLLLDTQAFKDTIDLFVERYKDKEISVVAGTFNLKTCSFTCSNFTILPELLVHSLCFSSHCTCARPVISDL